MPKQVRGVSVNGLTVTHELRPDKLAKLGDVAVGDLEGLLNRIRVRYIPLFSKDALAATSPPHLVPLRSAARTSLAPPTCACALLRRCVCDCTCVRESE